MLEYKIKISEGSSIEKKEIIFGDLYVDPYGKFISGSTSTSYGLQNGQKLLVQVGYDDITGQTYKLPVQCETVFRNGYFLNNEVYKVNSTPLNETQTLIWFIDGQDRLHKVVSDNIEPTLYFHIDGDKIAIENDLVKLPKRYYVEDGVVDVDGIIYETFLTEDGKRYPNASYNIFNIMEEGEIEYEYISINEYQTKFRIYKESDEKINLDTIQGGNYIASVQYKGVEYDVHTKLIIGENGETIEKKYIKTPKGIVYENEDWLDTFGDGMDRAYLQYQWGVHDTNCPYIFLYVKRNDTYKISEGEYIIKALNRNKSSVKYEVLDNKVFFDGKFYEIEENDTIDFVVLNEQEYQIQYTSPQIGYCLLNEIPIWFTVNENGNYVRLNVNNDNVDVEYKKKSYEYVHIDGTYYIVNVDENDNKCIVVNKALSYTLEIIEKGDDGLMICKLANMHEFDTDKTLYSNIIKSIVLNHKDYQFFVYKNTFKVDNILNEINIEDRLVTDGYFGIQSPISLYEIGGNFILPLYIEQSTAHNLFQEDIVNEMFINEEVNKRINDIVDMEHEVYYPVIKDNKGFLPIQEMIFDLHFRSRDDEGNIIDEKSWNFFEEYDYKQYCQSNSEFAYYQPSDLLCFLGFNDNDVFYQKSKLAKSFLRLSFYDSNNPLTQSLLATSTIFVDEKLLYSEYCKKYDISFLPYNKIGQKNIKKYKSSIIGVNCEGVVDNVPTFDEGQRISTRLTVQNKYQTSTSSEGFYLYLFRQYIEPKSTEETIYMRAQFYHAGTGKVLDMCFPIDDNGNILDMSKNTNVDEFKLGYKMREINSHLYTPIKVSYDAKNKCCVYYLPDGYISPSSNKSKMRLNLYELKIRDESQEPLN